MKILFCSEGSDQAEKAVRFGALIAAAFEAEASILGITEKNNDDDSLLQALRRSQDILKEHHVNAELITKAGKPVGEIVRRTRENEYDLVVIGAERKTTRHPLWESADPLWMSTRAYKIIESVVPPVLVVIGDHTELRRILLCTGGGHQADQAVEFTSEIARRVNAVVDLFHVMQEPPAMYADLIKLEEDADLVLTSNSRLGRTLRHQKGLLEQAGVFGELRLQHGLVIPEFLKVLQRTEYDLVVAGSSAPESRLRPYVMGDVTREIINRAEIPVLVVRHGLRQITRMFKGLLAHLFGPPKEPTGNAEG